MKEETSETKTPNPSAFSKLYKYEARNISTSLVEKRKLYLQKQKEKRCKAVDEKRDIDELLQDEEKGIPETAKKWSYKYKLMGSEWFTEIPEDMSENWLFKVCPEGVRFLVVANKGKTTCYYRNGKIGLKFLSCLPGGNFDAHPNKFTVLDCVYNKVIHTFFVCDVLAWNSMSLINSEAQMRFFWLKSKFEENPELCNISHLNKYVFQLNDCIPACNDLLQDRLFTPQIIKDTEIIYEGVLFYHKMGHYIYCRSPLVGWLKTFMLPEVLHIDVPLQHTKGKPQDYKCISEYLKKNKRDTRDVESVKNVDMEDITNEEIMDTDISQDITNEEIRDTDIS